MPHALQFLVFIFAGWLNRHQEDLTDYLREDAVDGFLRGTRHLIHDRDPLYTCAFLEILKSSGVQPLGRLFAPYARARAFREAFLRHAATVLILYPRARLEAREDVLILRPGPPHVRPKTG